MEQAYLDLKEFWVSYWTEKEHNILPTAEKTDDISRRHQQFLRERRLRNERRNSILMTRHYPDLGSASDWLKQISQAAQPIRSTTQMWVATRQQQQQQQQQHFISPQIYKK